MSLILLLASMLQLVLLSRLFRQEQSFLFLLNGCIDRGVVGIMYPNDPGVAG